MRLARAVALALGILTAPRDGYAEGLTLDEAVAAAREASQSVERARLEIDAAVAGRRQARASFGPRVDANVGAAYATNPPEGITIPTGAFGTVTDPTSTFPARVPDRPIVLVPDPDPLGFSASIAVEQPLFTWGKLAAAQDAASAAIEAGMARHDQSVRELRRAVTLAYAGVASGRESALLVEEIVAMLESRALDAARRLDAGAATRADVLTEESRLATARSQLVRARQGALTAEASLRRLLGREFGELAGIEAPWRLPEECDLVEAARSADPRLTELRATTRQAEVRLRVASASRPLLPDLGLRVQAEVRGQRVPFFEANWVDAWEGNVTVSVGASALIYDGGRSRADAGIAQSQYQQALSAVTEYADGLPLQVRRAVERYLVAQAAGAEAEARAANAREQERVAQVAFDNEVISRSELTAARLAVPEARLAAVAAHLDLSLALADLEYLVGPLSGVSGH